MVDDDPPRRSARTCDVCEEPMRPWASPGGWVLWRCPGCGWLEP